MHSLRTKITLLTVLVTILAVALVTVTSVVFIRNTENRKSDQLLLLLCETGERNLDYYFSSVENSVRKVAMFAEKDLNGLEDEKLAAHMDRVGAYFDEIANKTNGVLTYYYRIDPTVSDSVKGFWYTNLDGREFVSHPVTEISRYDTKDTSRLVWFTVPKHTGNPIWLPPYITDNLDVRVISYNIPIYYRGQFIGVIGIEIDYSVMAEQVESIRLYNNGYAFLTDANGKLIFHPRIDIANLSEKELPVLPDGLLSESTFTTYTYDGVMKDAVWLRLSNGMRLFVSVPDTETEGDWQLLIRDVIFVAAAVILLSVLLTHLITNRITRPLRALTEAAQQADQGNYDFTLNYHSDDEVGTLTKTFQRMAEHVQAHINDLNRRAYVDALTSVRNKGAFSDYLDKMQAQLNSREISADFAIGVFDCDNLKRINDQFGHDKGDIYLQTASRLICSVFHHSPVFRIGGDEFAVILMNEDFRNRETLISQFSQRSEEVNRSAGNDWEQVHVAIGVAPYDPEKDHSTADTMRRADKMMYRNKRQHKGGGEEA